MKFPHTNKDKITYKRRLFHLLPKSSTYCSKSLSRKTHPQLTEISIKQSNMMWIWGEDFSYSWGLGGSVASSSEERLVRPGRMPKGPSTKAGLPGVAMPAIYARAMLVMSINCSTAGRHSVTNVMFPNALHISKPVEWHPLSVLLLYRAGILCCCGENAAMYLYHCQANSGFYKFFTSTILSKADVFSLPSRNVCRRPPQLSLRSQMLFNGLTAHYEFPTGF